MKTPILNAVAVLALVAALAGCGHVQPTATQATGEAIAVTAAHLESAERDVDAVIPKAEGDARVHAESAKAEIVAAKKSNAEADSSFNRVAKQLAQVLASWAYKIGTFVMSCWYVFVGCCLASYLMRSAALLVPGPVGMGLSLASHVLLGVGTFGASAIPSILENVYWRRVQPAPQPAPAPDPVPPIPVAPADPPPPAVEQQGDASRVVQT